MLPCSLRKPRAVRRMQPETPIERPFSFSSLPASFMFASGSDEDQNANADGGNEADPRPDRSPAFGRFASGHAFFSRLSPGTTPFNRSASRLAPSGRFISRAQLL